VQSVPTLTVREIVTTIKSITARKIFDKHPEVKKFLWGGHIWTSGYYANTVGSHGTEEVIQQYVQKQGKEYKKNLRTAVIDVGRHAMTAKRYPDPWVGEHSLDNVHQMITCFPIVFSP
jgi:hypothetical protein